VPERSPDAVGSLDGPDPIGPGLRVGPHRLVAGLVSGEPARTQHPLVAVDNLDRGRQLVGIDPDDDLLHVRLPPVRVPMWTARRALLLRAERSLLEPRLVSGAGGQQTDSEPHPNAGGQPNRERTHRAPRPSLARDRSSRESLVAH
jgi:hypothetical protein